VKGQPEVPDRILLTTVNRLGDCVAFLPVAAAVRRRYPSGRITMMTRRAGAEAARLTGTVDEFIIVSGAREESCVLRARNFARALRAVRAGRFDLAFMASGDNSATCALLFLGGVKRRTGFDDCKLRGLLSVRVAAPEEELEARRNVRLLPAAGLPEELERPPCRIPAPRRAEAQSILEKAGACGGRRVMIHPGSSLAGRRWPARQFAEICARLLRTGLAQPVLVEGPGEPGLGAETRRLAGQQVPVISQLGGIDLLAAVMSECDLFVGHSSGPLQIAFLLGLRTVSLWGDTNPKIWGPAWEAERHVILRSPLPCAGCERWDPKRHVIVRGPVGSAGVNQPPCEHCVEGIPADEVFKAISGQLAADEGLVAGSATERKPDR